MNETAIFTLLAILIIGLVIAIFVVLWQLERKRRDALAAIANRLGLSLSSDRDRDLARQYRGLRGLNEGEDHYAFDVITGTHLGQHLTAFDFHYETSSTDSKGNRTTTDHYRHVVLLHFDRDFPNLIIGPENIFSKIAQAFGYDDIDFESHEFSRLFCVRSPDKKYAYDFCNALMIEFLLANPGLHLETQSSVLASVYEGRMSPTTIESELNLICAVRERMPNYLFSAP